MIRRSLQWRIALMTSLLIAVSCITMMVLLGGSGLRRMEEIGKNIEAMELRQHSKDATSGDSASAAPRVPSDASLHLTPEETPQASFNPQGLSLINDNR